MIFGTKPLTVQEKIKRGKIKLYETSPFFSYLLLNMTVKESKDHDTMAVDNKGNLYYNKGWVNKLTEEQMKGLLAHEVLHCALLHLERGKGRDHPTFNVANDLVINDMLKEQGFELPENGCIPDHNHTWEQSGCKIEKINEKSSEQVYDELMSNAPPKLQAMIQCAHGDSKGTDQEKQEAQKKVGGIDKHIYGNQDGKEESEDKQKRIQDWKKLIAEAATQAKRQGKLPANMERMVEDLLDSKVGWRHLLYKYITDQLPFDYNWSRPSKRSYGIGVHLPAVLKEMVDVTVSIDTSGSIGQDELKDFMSEIVGIAMSFENIRFNIVVCDAEVHEHYVLDKNNVDDITDLAMSGGGGTSHIPVYKFVQEKIPETKVLINFTDGYTSAPSNIDKYSFDSMWAITKNGTTERLPGEIIELGKV